jgi:hypothetical protein
MSSRYLFSWAQRGKTKETILYEALASRGYVVITMDQPYVANFAKFPGEAKVLTFRDVWKFPRNRDYHYRYDVKLLHLR